MHKEKVIVTENLTKKYGEITAVDNLNMEIYQGEICGLLGPNGAGKTTTILMLLGLTEPTGGRATVLGVDPTRKPLAVKRSVGYLPEHVGFYEHLTGKENLLYIASLNGISRGKAEEKVAQLACQVGLDQAIDRKVGEYSHGMRQRLGLASCLVKSPKLLILDEPTVGIDPQGTREVLDFIARLSRDEGITVLLSSHLLYQVQQICDRVAIFVKGKSIAVGPIENLSKQVMGEGALMTVEVQCQEGNHLLGRQLEHVEDIDKVEEREGKLIITSKKDKRKEIVSKVQELGLTLTHLRLRGFDLDDIYLKYFQGVERA